MSANPGTLRRLAKLRKRLNVVQKDCGICGERLGYRFVHGRVNWNLDHVWPRRFRHGHVGNIVLAHNRCNSAKGDRRPTGCEIIFLEVVNARLGLQ